MITSVGRLAAAAWVAALVMAWAPAAAAAGFYLQEQSVKGLGGAYSGEAADVGAESLWWNPAAIGELDGAEIYTGLHGVFSRSEVDDPGSTIQRPFQPAAPVGGDPTAHDPLRPGDVPNLDAAWRINRTFAVGLALSAPFDFTTKYPPSSFVRYQALTSRLMDFDLQPTVAIHLADGLDLGVGIDAQYAKAALSSALPNLSPLLPDGVEQLRGSGWDWGWVIGGQWRPAPRLTLGASYRSGIGHTLTGTAAFTGLLGPLGALNATLSASARFSTPWLVVVSSRYRLSDRLTLDAQMQRVGWSRFQAIDIVTPVGPSAQFQGYHDTSTGAVGLDYRVNRRLTVRGGVAYDPTPTPDIGRTGRVPDGDRWLFGLGATVQPARRLELDGALAYVHIARSPIVSDAAAYTGTPLVTPISYLGQAGGEAVIVSAGARMRF